MATSYSPKIVTEGLVLSLDAGNLKSYPRSGTNWTDLTANNNSGSLFNSPTFDTQNNGSIVFDGTDDYATVNVPAMSAYSLSFWLYVITLGVGERQIFTGPDDRASVSIVSSNWFSWSGTTSRTGVSMSTGVWYNFVLTGTISTANFYVNSSLTNTFANGATIPQGTGYICSYSDTSRELNARISNVSFYNRVLSQAEILQNFNATRGRFGI
jgi:hypothetical protein